MPRLLVQSDQCLTKILCLLLTWLARVCVWIVGGVNTILTPWVMFTYDEGFSDLSVMEISFLLLSSLLLWRHIRYSRLAQTGFWRSLTRLFMAQGILAGTALALLGLGAYIVLGTEYEQNFLSAIQQETPLEQLLNFALLALALYLAAPAIPLALEPNASIDTPESATHTDAWGNTR